MRKPGFKLSKISAAIMIASSSTFIQAQEETADNNFSLEEVVVTAQKRSEPLQTTPVAVTAISHDDIVRFDINDASDIDQLVPSLTITSSPTS